jgi:hypothetical protein
MIFILNVIDHGDREFCMLANLNGPGQFWRVMTSSMFMHNSWNDFGMICVANAATD